MVFTKTDDDLFFFTKTDDDLLFFVFNFFYFVFGTLNVD